jgi:hypothetical protein
MLCEEPVKKISFYGMLPVILDGREEVHGLLVDFGFDLQLRSQVSCRSLLEILGRLRVSFGVSYRLVIESV